MKKQKRWRKAGKGLSVLTVLIGLALGCPMEDHEIPNVICCYAAEKIAWDSCEDPVDRLIEKVNEERARYGIAALVKDQTLSAAARQRAKEQQELFAHIRPDGTPFYTIYVHFGIHGTRRGENLARGRIGTHDAIFQAWLDSDGHRDNILNEAFTKIGIGYVEIQGVGYWCQLFAD